MTSASDETPRGSSAGGFSSARMSGTDGNLSIPTLQVEADEFGENFTDVLKAALAYAGAGWYVGPVRVGTKDPGSILGKAWHTKTSRDPDVIAGWFTTGTPAGVFLHVGRSGAVVFDIDHPELIPPPLMLAALQLQAPRQTTRAGTLRGHLLFGQPPGRLLGNGLGQLGKAGGYPGWGDIRGANGVIVVAPSVHPDAADGGAYGWFSTGPVPQLPDELAQLLPDASPAEDAADDRVMAWAYSTWTQDAHPWAQRVALDEWARAMALGESRHNTAVAVACWLARDARAGLYPLRSGLQALGALFVDSLQVGAGSGRIERDAAARSEWRGIAAWAVGQALAEAGEAIVMRRQRAEEQAARYQRARAGDAIPGAVVLGPGVAGPGGEPAPGGSSTAAVTLSPDDRVGLLPDEFWTARPVLEHLRTAAHARLVSPDALLAAVLCRISAFVPPAVRVDAGLGPASLNLYAAVIGNSSDGKTLSMSCAAELIARPPSLVDEPDSDRFALKEEGLGSGEGVAEAFMGNVRMETGEVTAGGVPKTKTVRRVVRHHAAFTADEGELLTKLGERSGSTIGGVIRTAWMGAALGQANATAETKRKVPAGQYALSLIAGFQPGAVGPLLSEQEIRLGTPGRFVFLSVTHPDGPDEGDAEVSWPGPLEAAEKVLRVLHEPQNLVPGPVGGPGGSEAVLGDPGALGGQLDRGVDGWRLLELEPAIRTEIRNHRIGRLRRRVEVAPIDGHGKLVQLKLAALLALLDGRTGVTSVDWGLAGQVWETSCALRGWLQGWVSAEAKRAAGERREAMAATTARGAELTAQQAEQQLAERVERLARQLAAWVHEVAAEHGGAVLHGAMRKRVNSRARQLYDDAIEAAESAGWVVVGADQSVSPGVDRPPDQ